MTHEDMIKNLWANTVPPISDNDCWLWKLALNSAGYGYIGVGKERIGVHRFSYTLLIGAIPEGFVLDHICHVKHCINPKHLRLATQTENLINSFKTRANKSGFKGVSWCENAKKWRAFIKIDGKNKHLGLFLTPELAHESYCKKAIEVYGEFANFG